MYISDTVIHVSVTCMSQINYPRILNFPITTCRDNGKCKVSLIFPFLCEIQLSDRKENQQEQGPFRQKGESRKLEGAEREGRSLCGSRSDSVIGKEVAREKRTTRNLTNLTRHLSTRNVKGQSIRRVSIWTKKGVREIIRRKN